MISPQIMTKSTFSLGTAAGASLSNSILFNKSVVVEPDDSEVPIFEEEEDEEEVCCL